MKIIHSAEFDSYWKTQTARLLDIKTEKTVKKIIDDVRAKGDAAVRKYALKFDRCSPRQFEAPFCEAKAAIEKLRANNPELAKALEVAADNIKRFSLMQKEQFTSFEYEIKSGLFTGQRVIPVERAGVYVPGGRFPLFSSVLMGLIPAFCAGVDEAFLVSPPAENGLPDFKILAATAVAVEACGVPPDRLRVFSIGGAQAIAAMAFGTESVPRADVIAGPGNKYVAAAKKRLYGQVGIDFIAGPSDVLVITDGGGQNTAALAAADMLAQAEHDPDARARALAPDTQTAESIKAEIEKRLNSLPNAAAACASISEGGLIVVYKNKENAVRIANAIAPEHLELQTADAQDWAPLLKNYGSLFINSLSAEALGDYSAGLNHTLPTSGSSRFTGGLSVRHFLKTVTTLRCTDGAGFREAVLAAQTLATAEGLEAHAQSAAARNPPSAAAAHT
jgi:histidinol dehydrogenase